MHRGEADEKTKKMEGDRREGARGRIEESAKLVEGDGTGEKTNTCTVILLRGDVVDVRVSTLQERHLILTTQQSIIRERKL